MLLILLQLALAGMGIGFATVISGPFFLFFFEGDLSHLFVLASGSPPSSEVPLQ